MAEPNLQAKKPVFSPGMWAILLAAVAFAAAWPAMMIFPDQYDSCIFLWMGQRMWHGQLPYRDLWDNKSPVLYWLNAAVAWTGRPAEAIYVLQSLALAAGAWLVYGIGRRLISEWPARFAGLAYATFAATPVTLMTGNLTEPWAAPVALLCVYAMLRHAEGGQAVRFNDHLRLRPAQALGPGENASRYPGKASRFSLWPLLSGLGLGVAACFRQPALLVGAVLLVLLPALWRRRRIGVTAVLLWLIGFALVPAAMVAWARSNGTFDAMVDQCVKFNLVYGLTGSKPSWATWQMVAERFAKLADDTLPWHAAAALGLGVLLMTPGRKGSARPAAPLGWAEPIDLPQAVPIEPWPLEPPVFPGPYPERAVEPGPPAGAAFPTRAVVIVWLLAAVASALPSLRFYNHHYYLALAPLSLLIGAAWEPLLGRSARGRVGPQLLGWLLAAAMAAGVGVCFDSAISEGLLTSRWVQPVRRAGDLLAKAGSPDQSLFVFGWGEESDLLARLAWPSPTRHVMVIFYPELPNAEQMLTEWRNDMLADPPEWLVCRQSNDLVTGQASAKFGWDQPAVARIAGEIHAAYRDLYEPAGDFRFGDDRLIVYRKKSGWLIADRGGDR